MSDNYVPLDIWREILIRLPAKSLIRSRAVCKRWRAVIDDPPFVRAHQQQLTTENLILFTHNSTHMNSAYCCSVDLEALRFSNGHQSIPATPLHHLKALSSKLQPALGVSACNGLILTDLNVKPFEIWNPFTHERLDLPPPRDFQFSRVMAFGLGYDYVTDDYKAVVILSRTHQTHVYSLKSDSWTSIINMINMNCPPWCPTGPGVFVCGALNWLCFGNDGHNKIVALDLGTEKYRLIQMPHLKRMGSSNYPGMFLDVLGGCLILWENSYSGCLDVWVMKGYGDEGSWTKLLSIDWKEKHFPWLWASNIMLVAFIRKEEEDKRPLVFLQVEGYGDLTNFFVFDVETNSMKRVFIHGFDQHLYARKMFPGSIFRLHANCGAGARPKSGTNTKKAANEKLVFCIKDANYSYANDPDDGWEYILSSDCSQYHSGTK